jgi:dienelactone hydrolase
MKWLRRLLVVLVLILVLGGAGFVAWASATPAPMPEAIAALQSDQQVQVDTERWLTFTPLAVAPRTGFIFYPGGKVDPRSYAPAAKAIAQQGFLVVIVPMPLNLAVFGAGRASDVIAAHPDTTNWVVGGHSLGGSMAANYARSHSGQVSGLALWASYPASSDDLSGLPLAVASISGNRDGLSTTAKIDASRPLLPANTLWLAIAGGNHAQFGWYGDQAGDNPATISRAEQQRITVEATVKMLRSLE